MRVLALDTTARSGSVAIIEDQRVLIERSGDASRSHAERLPGDLIDVLGAINCTVQDIDLFAVASGPGSFTGLRIGLAAIQGLAVVAGKPAMAVSALDALAVRAASQISRPSRVAVWIDAMRQEVFSAVYQLRPAAGDDIDDVQAIEPATAEAPAAVLERWRHGNLLPDAIIGDGAQLYRAMLDGVVGYLQPPPLAGAIGQLAVVRAAAGQATSPAALQPLYVRRTDVEMTRDRLADAGRPSSPGSSRP